MLFDLSDYRLRKLDPAQGTKPLDFGGGGITGSINLDGRFIAINTYHPEHGYITLTSVPPFPDEDRYDQAKVRAYRKSLVTNEGFGLEFEQEIIEREYYLIEDAVPFIRFTLADGTVAECVTIRDTQEWKFSNYKVKAKYTGRVSLQRSAYSQLTEGGLVDIPSHKTEVVVDQIGRLALKNSALDTVAVITSLEYAQETSNGCVEFSYDIELSKSYQQTVRIFPPHLLHNFNADLISEIDAAYFLPKEYQQLPSNLILQRAKTYANYCIDNPWGDKAYVLTDHMILPLSWHRDSYYVMRLYLNPDDASLFQQYLKWLFKETWRGTYCAELIRNLPEAWGRSYMANGKQKDSKRFQLDQQIFPLLAFADFYEKCASPDLEDEQVFSPEIRDYYEPYISRILKMLDFSDLDFGLHITDETPADDDIPLPFHFSSHILLWHTLKRLEKIFPNYHDGYLKLWIDSIHTQMRNRFVTEHNGKQIYSYATDGADNHYLYHDANDIPLVMMPLWGFCEKDDPVWLNTIEFAFSDDNPGFFDGVLGSVHTPAPWALGDAQELIYCKVVGDRERYQRVWERLEKAMQWDGALPEAYDAKTFEVVSRHWFAWPNAMVAIADSISWDWETEGEYVQ